VPVTPDARREKTQAAAHRSAAPARLRAFVALAFGGDRPELTRLTGFRALGTLMSGMARFALDDAAVTARDLDAAQRLAGAIPVYELRRPRDLSRIGESADALLTLYQGEPHGHR
jgi:hypothetical protein